MKRILAILAIATTLCSCGGTATNNNSNSGQAAVAQGPVFAPQKRETIVTRHAVTNPLEDVMRFQGAVRFMIVVPETIDTKSAEMLQNKLLAIASVNGMAAMGGDPGICMVPNLSLLSADVTSTIPAKHKVTYNFTIHIGNLATGDIYGNMQTTIMGVGDSQELAMINAVSSIDANDNRYQQMLQSAQEQVISYYNTHGETVLNMAKGYVASNKYAEAMAILSSVPSVCADLYVKAVDMKNKVLGAKFATNADELVAKMEAALGLARDDMNGYCAEAMSFYAMIPANSPAKAKADKIYTDYLKTLDPNAKLNWERECRQWESDEKERARKHELSMYKEEMATKVAIDGQTALLNKYKLDESHNKRGKFWKFFYNREE